MTDTILAFLWCRRNGERQAEKHGDAADCRIHHGLIRTPRSNRAWRPNNSLAEVLFPAVCGVNTISVACRHFSGSDDGKAISKWPSLHLDLPAGGRTTYLPVHRNVCGDRRWIRVSAFRSWNRLPSRLHE